MKLIRTMLIIILGFAAYKACAAEEKKFVIVITSFDNRDWLIKNLGTVFDQEYSNYRVIYVDDCSTDGTAELVEHFIIARGQMHRCTLIKNTTRKRALANLYAALMLCEPDEIVFNYDGDDWFADNQVFSFINNVYQDPNVWITYGQFINWPTGDLGYCKEVTPDIVEKQLYRQKWWKPGQLRTFYAWLFHQIKLKDLIFEGPYFEGQFFPANADLAVYYPMMEMAGQHYKFIPDIIYIRNVQTPLNDFKANKDVQILGSKILRAKQKYAKLSKPEDHYFEDFATSKADVIFFSQNPAQAQEFISTFNRLALHASTIFVIHPTQMGDAYATLAGYQNVVLVPETNYPTFKETVAHCLIDSSTQHILFAHDGIVVNRFIDFNECIQMLEKTFAYGFYLSLAPEQTISRQTGYDQPVAVCNNLLKDLYAWAFGYTATGDYRAYNNLSMTLYRKSDVLKDFNSLEFSNPQELIHAWKECKIDLENVGLCYEKPKVGYISWLR